MIILTPSILLGALYDDITVLNSSDVNLRFKVNFDQPEKYIIRNTEDSTYSLIIPVMIGVPVDAEPLVRNIKATNYGTLSVYGYVPQSSGMMVEITGVRMVRGRKLANLVINPLKDDRYAGEIEISIDFIKNNKSVPTGLKTTDDKVYDKIFSNSILNYDSFAAWPSAIKSKTSAKTGDDIFSKSSSWVKIGISEQGFTKITGGDLRNAGLTLGNIKSDSIRIFYGGGMPLPVFNSSPRPEFNEIAIKVFDGGDGRFDANDSILFFAESADRWRYPTDSEPIYLNNHYTDLIYYWLTPGGEFTTPANRIGTEDGTPSGAADTMVTSTRFYRHEEQNNLLLTSSDNHIYDYYRWYWSNNNQVTFLSYLSNVINTDISDSVYFKVVAETDDLLLFINGLKASELSVSKDVYTFYAPAGSNMKQGFNSIMMNMTVGYNAPYLDYVEINYPGILKPSDEILDFTVESFGATEIVMEDDFTNPTIYDITDPDNPVEVTGSQIESSEITYEIDFPDQTRKRFWAYGQNKVNSPTSVELASFTDLRQNKPNTDLIIITPRVFASYLEDYKQYREEKSNISINIVAVEDIYDQFSYGLFDPTAIRDFLKYASENYPEPAPSAVLLVGDGHYDFKNIKGTGRTSFIPPYIHAYDNTASDDNYIYFGDYGILDSDSSYLSDQDILTYDMMVARWPVNSAADIANIITKIEAYESPDNQGLWKSKITFVADDEISDSFDGLIHVIQSEELIKNYVPSSFIRDKIYLWDYPTNSQGDKPEVNDQIVNSLNDGRLIINYVGHGNPDLWAHEHVFTRDDDLPRLTNNKRLPLVFAASCSIGFFDDPAREGMSEELLRMRTGAICTVSAVRVVYSNENSKFNQMVFQFLFDDNDLSICQEVFAAKMVRQYIGSSYPYPKSNDRKFAFFGDPFLKLGSPYNEVQYTSAPSELKALDKHSVSGRIIDNDSNEVAFNGDMDILVFDSEINKIHKNIQNEDDIIEYAMTGPVIYKGSSPVTSGLFDYSFIAPLDIGFGGQGAKIFGYATSDESDAFGLIDSLPISSEIAETMDSSGPNIEFTFGGKAGFISGDRITADDKLDLIISDSSGINLTGGTSHRISLMIDNNMENIVNLTDLFKYDAGSYTSGAIEYEIEGLTPGNHRFKVKAWDNANNASTVEFDAQVIEAGGLMLTDVMNYPNPMEEKTTFSFYLTSPARSVSLEIFTLAGKKILSYSQNSVTAQFHQFYSWNGHDADGDRVATGVYIYKVTAASSISDDVAESYGKVVVVN